MDIDILFVIFFFYILFRIFRRARYLSRLEIVKEVLFALLIAFLFWGRSSINKLDPQYEPLAITFIIIVLSSIMVVWGVKGIIDKRIEIKTQLVEGPRAVYWGIFIVSCGLFILTVSFLSRTGYFDTGIINLELLYTQSKKIITLPK